LHVEDGDRRQGHANLAQQFGGYGKRLCCWERLKVGEGNSRG